LNSKNSLRHHNGETTLLPVNLGKVKKIIKFN